MKSTKRRPIRWMRLAALFTRLAALTLLCRFLQDWLNDNMHIHELIWQKAVGFIYLLLIFLFVIPPLLRECGEKVDPLPWEREK